MSEPDPWLVAPGQRLRLADVDPEATVDAPGNKQKTVEVTESLLARLSELQDRFWAQRRNSLLLVLQGMDTSGKDGTISHVARGLNPQGIRVATFKQPTEEELSHDYLWRVHKQMPALGELCVFNRSHYEDVLIVRVHGLVPEDRWKRRYEQINAFEEMLTQEGMTVVKCFLHISREEQARRLRARLEDPTKRWKFKMGDLAERARWDDYWAAYEEALTRTSTEWAPWRIISADHKWYRNYAISKILVDALERLHPEYPQPEDIPDGVVIA